MANASIDHVKAAIRASGATGNAAEVLATITALSIPKSTGEQLWSFGGFAEVLGFELVSAFDAKLQELGYEWVRLLLGSGKVQPAGDLFQGQVTALVEAGHLAPEHGELLKRVGRWQESPLEHANGERGLTTDELTVETVLDEIAAEQELQVYNHRQALLSIVLQPDGKAIVSCRVVATTETGQQGETLSAVSTADADSFELPSDLAAALTAVRQFVAGV